MSYQPQYEISSGVLNLLTKASELRNWIDSTALKVSRAPILKSDTAFRLAHSSTAIEGNPLSLEQVKHLAQGETVHAPAHAKKEVLDYLQALKWIEKQPAKAGLTEQKILFLHQLISKNTLAKNATGHYKKKQNRIIDAKGRTIYMPPSPKAVRKLTCALVTWIQQTRKTKLHPLIVSAIAHHRLVSIHPFSDGNGRTARALALWILYTREFDTHHLFALDEYFEAARQKYYDKIQQVRELDEMMTYWLEYMAEALVDTLENTKERVMALQVQSKGKPVVLSVRQEQVLRFVQEKGIVRAPQMMYAFKLTRSRVNQIIKPLVDAGILVQEGKTRATAYRLA